MLFGLKVTDDFSSLTGKNVITFEQKLCPMSSLRTRNACIFFSAPNSILSGTQV